MTTRGTVIKSTGSWYKVILDQDHTIVDARIKGKFRLEGKTITNPIAVGDHVTLSIDTHGGDYVITDIDPRRNYLARQSPRNRLEMHLIASNIDLAVLITTLIQPDVKFGFIDRFLLMCEVYRLHALIVFNKSDLWDADARETYEAIASVYQQIGYEVLCTSILTGENMDTLQSYLQDRISVISGQSGVGKSSLVNALQPEIDLKTGGISDSSGKGQHTTTFAEMHFFDFGGAIIDSPGLKTLGFNNLEPEHIAHNYREIFA